MSTSKGWIGLADDPIPWEATTYEYLPSSHLPFPRSESIDPSLPTPPNPAGSLSDPSVLLSEYIAEPPIERWFQETADYPLWLQETADTPRRPVEYVNCIPSLSFPRVPELIHGCRSLNSSARFACPLCSTTFSRNADLKRHLGSIHVHQHYYCPVIGCDRGDRPFSRKDKLKEHEVRVHGISQSQDSRERQAKSALGPEAYQDCQSPAATSGSRYEPISHFGSVRVSNTGRPPVIPHHSRHSTILWEDADAVATDQERDLVLAKIGDWINDAPKLVRYPLIPDLRDGSYMQSDHDDCAFTNPKVNPTALYARPQVILFNGVSAWIFPVVSLSQLTAKLRQVGIVTRSPEASQSSSPSAKPSRSTNSHQRLNGSRVVSGRIGKLPANLDEMSNVKLLNSGKKRNRQSEEALNIRFGCPFCKLNPIRYLLVRGKNRSPCTDRPGLVFDHIK
jgi:hypothetical protein